ncbi:MAG: DMT family transporter [Candidatus Eiseniibacteriota bacterium]|nr:MAG: DMT family transporter [Candidatus Eisenbacteria bacterium]
MGEFYALMTAIMWASAVIFLKRSGETIPPFALNVFRVAVSTVALVLTLVIIRQEVFRQAPLSDYIILFASGVIGIAVSDTFFLMALNRVGAGIMAIVDCLYAPFVVLFAFFLLGEELGLWQYAGMALVITGVLIAARHKPPEGVAVRQIIIGSLYGFLSMATVAFGIVIAKPILHRSPVLWATTIRQIGALAAMLPVALAVSNRRQIFSLFRPAHNWRYSVPATFLGSYLSLIFWIAGMKYTLAGAAAILNQTSSIYILILASIFLREPFTARKVIATALAILGIVMVTMG